MVCVKEGLGKESCLCVLLSDEPVRFSYRPLRGAMQGTEDCLKLFLQHAMLWDTFIISFNHKIIWII